MAKRRNSARRPAASTSTAPKRRRRISRAPAPDFHNTLSSVLGGGGGALLGGFLANQGWDPSMVALAMTVGGGVGAYTLDGNMRIAANGIAAAGAGQLALALMARSVEKDEAKNDAKPATKSNGVGAKTAPANAALPPGAIEAAFERARHRLAMEDDDVARFTEVIDVDGEEYVAA